MKHSTILVPVKCSDKEPKQEDTYYTSNGERIYMPNQLGQEWRHLNGAAAATPDFWYEEQRDKIVLDEKLYNRIVTALSGVKKYLDKEILDTIGKLDLNRW